MDNPRCHNGKKVAAEIEDRGLARAPPLPVLQITVLAIFGALI
jgi:hypothetical protein